jgi:hypothetical protein
VEGIVVNAVGMREEGLNRLQQSALPMVLIDRKIPEFACDVVGWITPRPPPPPPNIWWKRASKPCCSSANRSARSIPAANA